MSRRKPRLLASALAVVAACVAGGCRREEVVTVELRSDVHWWVGHEGEWAPQRNGLARKELAAIDLPKVPAAGVEPETFTLDQRPRPRFTMNVFESGSLMFKGKEYPSFATDERAGNALKRELVDLTRGLQKRNTPVSILIRADYRAPWSGVATLIEWSRGAMPTLDSIDVSTNAGVQTMDGVIRGALSVGDEEATKAAIEVVGEGALASKRVRIGERVWTFPAGDAYARASID